MLSRSKRGRCFASCFSKDHDEGGKTGICWECSYKSRHSSLHIFHAVLVTRENQHGKGGGRMHVESIGDVLRTVYTHQSGLLKAEWAQDGRTDKGELYLLSGQPMYARVGKVGGQDALAYMLTWRTVHLSFLADAPRPPANLPPQIHLFPSGDALHTSPRDHSPVSSVTERSTQAERETFIPQKTESKHSALSLSLTRRQRLVYFLIDGQRTITDISRCSSRTKHEVEVTLRELYRIGLII